MDKILIIDSSQLSLDLLSQRLSNIGYHIFNADTGFSGFSKAKLFIPDLIILSDELSDISGYDLCRKIKNDEETKNILILMVSSLNNTNSNIRAFEVGANDFIEKNSDSIVFLSKVKSLLHVKHLLEQLRQKYVELEEKDKILDYQLKMAKQVQRSLIKDYDITIDNTYFMSKYMPSMDVGGDFYDIITLDENRIGVVMGDVSGHGFSAALLTSMLSMMFKNLSIRYKSPNLLLFHMNNQFCRAFEYSDNDKYACVFYAIINTFKKEITFSNAGHPLPFFSIKKTNYVTELESYGVPIGIIKDSKYENYTVEYNSGDILLLHTDGLSDTFFKDSPEKFSLKMKEILKDALSMNSIEEVLNIILNSFYNYNASTVEKLILDDVSLIMCKL